MASFGRPKTTTTTAAAAYYFCRGPAVILFEVQKTGPERALARPGRRGLGWAAGADSRRTVTLEFGGAREPRGITEAPSN